MNPPDLSRHSSMNIGPEQMASVYSVMQGVSAGQSYLQGFADRKEILKSQV